MRCLTSPPSHHTRPLAAIMHGSLLLSCLLLISSSADAARSPRQRAEQRNSYLVLPPGLGQDVGEGSPAKGLGEKEFVSNRHHQGRNRQQLTNGVDAETHLPSWIARLPGPPPIYGHPTGCSDESHWRLWRNIRTGAPSPTRQSVFNNNSTPGGPTEVEHRSLV
jgi:hypothetical protein